jgi:hypothetical protein
VGERMCDKFNTWLSDEELSQFCTRMHEDLGRAEKVRGDILNSYYYKEDI